MIDRLARRCALPAVSVLALLVAGCGAPEPSGAEQAGASGGAVGAQGPLSGQSINDAAYQATPQHAPPAQEGQPAAQPQPSPALIRAQVLLARARFSPGAIDGLGGTNTRQALAAWQEAQGLEASGDLTPETYQRLIQAGGQPVTTEYEITQQDIAGPYIGVVPTEVEPQSKLPAMGYGNIVEALAERFHVSEALLRAMNPSADFNRAGQRLVVPSVGQVQLPADVARIVVDKSQSAVMAYDEGDQLIGFFPATIGSGDNPTPSGTLKVNGVANDPDYVYDPDKLSYGTATERLVVKPGPNNPVGVVWIDLNKPSYGIHGAPEPETIGKTASHGCVRLTNWDVQLLAARVKPGVQVVFQG